MEQHILDKLKVVLVGIKLESLKEPLEECGCLVQLVKNRFIPIDEKKDLYIFYIKDRDFTSLFNGIIKIIKRKFPESKTMFLGPFAWKYPSKILIDSCADFICIGYNDCDTILELCQNFGQKTKYASIIGLGYKDLMFIPKMIHPWTGIYLSNKRPKKCEKCGVCKKQISKNDGYVSTSEERVCLPCVTTKMNAAIMTFPISGAGED